MIARVAAVSDEILHPVSEEQVLSTVANCGSGVPDRLDLLTRDS
jgi:hypothetical protein